MCVCIYIDSAVNRRCRDDYAGCHDDWQTPDAGHITTPNGRFRYMTGITPNNSQMDDGETDLDERWAQTKGAVLMNRERERERAGLSPSARCTGVGHVSTCLMNKWLACVCVCARACVRVWHIQMIRIAEFSQVRSVKNRRVSDQRLIMESSTVTPLYWEYLGERFPCVVQRYIYIYIYIQQRMLWHTDNASRTSCQRHKNFKRFRKFALHV